MKIAKRGTVAYDGKRLSLKGWSIDFEGDIPPGDINDGRSERSIRAMTAVLIHIAARSGVKLQEVRPVEIAISAKAQHGAEVEMLRAIQRASRQPRKSQ